MKKCLFLQDLKMGSTSTEPAFFHNIWKYYWMEALHVV